MSAPLLPAEVAALALARIEAIAFPLMNRMRGDCQADLVAIIAIAQQAQRLLRVTGGA